MQRRMSKKIRLGNIFVGGGAPVTVQSMTNTVTSDFESTYSQIMRLAEAGCEIVRMTVPDFESARIFERLKARGVDIPLVADIHFNHELAVAAAMSGADKIRINPGNIGSEEGVRLVADTCRGCNIPIRIGVNSGSLEREILEEYGAPTPEALAKSALYHAELLEKFDFRNIILSVKASTVGDMISANRILSEKTDYPLHLGVTEAGGGRRAEVKSAVGIGALLAEGIGDTVRVSLTDDPVEEVYLAREILSSLDLLENPGMDIVSCPTCGRTGVDLISLARDFRELVKREGLDKLNIKVALMGCAVNGPGEAREADIGIAAGRGEGLLFKKGKIVRKIAEKDLLVELIKEIKLLG